MSQLVPPHGSSSLKPLLVPEVERADELRRGAALKTIPLDSRAVSAVSMLAMGASKPWPEALKAVTGTEQMDASALVEYFQPLMGWLEEQNKGQQCGW